MSGWRSRVTSSKIEGERELKLANAYRDVFKRGEQPEMILADLAQFTGFYAVAEPNTSNEALQYNAGQRAAFARILHFLTLSDTDMQGLEQAARAESEHFNS